MRIKETIVVLLLAIYPQLILAKANRVGNGGDIVRCDSPRNLATILDFYEVWRFEDPWISEKGSASEILERVLARLSDRAPELARQYKKRSETIWGEIDFSDEIKPVEIADSVHGFEPAEQGCKVRQLAIRLYDQPEGSKRFIINNSLYKTLKPSAQAGLILHEIIYEHLAKLGETDSRRVRKLVSHIFAPEFANESKGRFWIFVTGLKIPIYP